MEGSAAVDGVVLRLVDLPGIVSLEAHSPDEQVTIDWLQADGGPDVLCVVLDSAKLSLELQLFDHLAREIDRPVVSRSTSSMSPAAAAPPSNPTNSNANSAFPSSQPMGSPVPALTSCAQHSPGPRQSQHPWPTDPTR